MTQEQKEILKHANKHIFYCGGGPDMDSLCDQGLMAYAGKKSFVPDPYYKITNAGKKALEANA
jgi:hypothetical protein